MIDLTIEYQPFSFLPYKRKISGSFPSAFDELSAPQLVAVAKLTKNSISENSFLHILTGFKNSTLRKFDDYHRYSLMNLFTIFTEIKTYHSFIIPSIETSSVTLYSPQPKLSGVNIAQFIFADSYFSTYQEHNKLEDLQKFIASLYLPENTPFSEQLIINSSQVLANVKPELLEAIIINYVFVKEWLCLAYPMVFIRLHDPENQATKKKIQKSDNGGWLKIFESIVGDDIVNYDRYAIIPVHNLFRWMTGKFKENRKHRRS